MTNAAENQSIRITVTRDSVSMGDDVEAPHFLVCERPGSDSLSSIINLLFKENYLPSVSRTRHSWAIRIEDKVIARVQGNSKVAEFEVSAATTLATFAIDLQLEFHVHYRS